MTATDVIRRRIATSSYLVVIAYSSELKRIAQWIAQQPSQGHEVIITSYIAEPSCPTPPVGVVVLLKTAPGASVGECVRTIRDTLSRDRGSVEILRAEWVDLSPRQGRRGDVLTRRVSVGGRMRFRGHRYYISGLLAGQDVDLELADPDLKVYSEGVLVKLLRSADNHGGRGKPPIDARG